MNRHFVNIKVDREERPDLDQIYQTGAPAAHAARRRLAADDVPDAARASPSSAAPTFRSAALRPAGLRRPARAGGRAVERAASAGRSAGRRGSCTFWPTRRPHAAASSRSTRSRRKRPSGLRDAMMQSFDEVDGGFGGAPKFPQPSSVGALLRAAHAQRRRRARATRCCYTLRRMAEGGMYDQLGGGFCRYSIDAQWAIPHFEKMLYDNGPLLRAVRRGLAAHAATPLYAQSCEQTAAWLMREMQGERRRLLLEHSMPTREGEEGKFYVWTRDEVAAAARRDEYAAFAAHYGLDAPPNFEAASLAPARGEAAARGRGAARPIAGRVRGADRERARKLLGARDTRVRPGRDEKVLTSWNALGDRRHGARGARVRASRAGSTSARRAIDFVRADAVARRPPARDLQGRPRASERLSRRPRVSARRAARARCRADLLDAGDLRFARALADLLLEQFEDRERRRLLLHQPRP